MLLAERHHRILEALVVAGRTVVELADDLQVSESTIRRDLDALAAESMVERKYGGAIITADGIATLPSGGRTMLTAGSRETTTDSGTPESPIGQRHRDDLDLRIRVAAAAAELVQDNDIVVLDIGETTPLLARSLRGRPVTVITSNLSVFDELRDDARTEVVLLGGVLRRNQQSLVGPLALQAISSLNADILFLSCTGVRNGMVLDHMAVEAPIKQALVAASERVVLLASEGKFPGTGAMRLCSLDDVDVVITTDGLPAAELKACRAGGRKVLIA